MSQVLSQCFIRFMVVSALIVTSKKHKCVRVEVQCDANKTEKKAGRNILVLPYACHKPCSCNYLCAQLNS